MNARSKLSPVDRAMMIRELMLFLLRNLGNRAVGWPRQRASGCLATSEGQPQTTDGRTGPLMVRRAIAFSIRAATVRERRCAQSRANRFLTDATLKHRENAFAP